jgi:SAM-dependent methyltransferase
MIEAPRRRHLDALNEHLSVAGARLLDVGCGDGALVRSLTRAGARATGIEIDAAALAPALAAARAGEEDYVEGRGEALPFPDASFDIAIYFNSLHHVPTAAHRAALTEAARVLRPAGTLWIVEPIAEGRYFELTRPLEDESDVRAAAYEAIKAVEAGPALRGEAEIFYRSPMQFDDFPAWVRRYVSVDPARRAVVEKHRAALARRFEELAERRADGFHFDLPTRANLLRRTG